jgi:SAM-dependent methyltransferase
MSKIKKQSPASSHSNFEMDRDYFNRYESGYSPYTSEDIKLLLTDLVQEINKYKMDWICEVGSADGQFSSELYKILGGNFSIIGLDIAVKVLRLFPFNRVCGDAFYAPLKDKCLDLVCFPATLHHLFPFSAALNELNRVLTPGGLIYFLEPNYFHPQRRFFMSRSKLYHLYRQANDVPVNPNQLKKMLNELGIEVIAIRFINIHFKSPSILQSLQNILSQWKLPAWLHKYIMPWFILIGVKRQDNET